jgi:hypothetical protein
VDGGEAVLSDSARGVKRIATSPASTPTLKLLASRNDPAGKAFPYRPLTEADVGCPHLVQGVRQEVAANDYALDYIWPELAGKRVYLIPGWNILLAQSPHHASEGTADAATRYLANLIG